MGHTLSMIAAAEFLQVRSRPPSFFFGPSVATLPLTHARDANYAFPSLL